MIDSCNHYTLLAPDHLHYNLLHLRTYELTLIDAASDELVFAYEEMTESILSC